MFFPQQHTHLHVILSDTLGKFCLYENYMYMKICFLNGTQAPRGQDGLIVPVGL